MPASWVLVGLMVVVHLYGCWEGASLLGELSTEQRVALGGQYRSLISAGEWWRLCSSVFVHANLVHLLLNAIALYALGRLIEPWLGPIRFAAWFCVGGLAGSVASHLAGLVQSDGASGGLFALLGATLVLGWQQRHQLSPEDRRLLGPILLVFLSFNVLLSFLVPSLDAVGHLGGLAMGVGLAFIIGRRRLPGARVLETLVLTVFGGAFFYVFR
ncbi:MAG: rhomboid family intramembrane serine protease [Proteobacteria bacterium]|nr:rhomboid family intramembrane serine protease [Pseudomonadota bacterium]